MRILSTKFPHISERSSEVPAVIVPSRFPLALTAQELAKATLQVCKWRVTLTGMWSSTLKMCSVEWGFQGPTYDISETGEINIEVELDNRSSNPEEVVLAMQPMSSGGQAFTGGVIISSDGVSSLTSVYGASVSLSLLQSSAADEYGVGYPCRWLRKEQWYLPSLLFSVSPQYVSGSTPFWGGTPMIKSLHQSGDDPMEVAFLDKVIPCGVSFPAVGGPPPSFDPPDGSFLWDLVTAHNLTCEITPIQWRAYDPGDGLGPIYNSATGNMIRSMY